MSDMTMGNRGLPAVLVERDEENLGYLQGCTGARTGIELSALFPLYREAMEDSDQLAGAADLEDLQGHSPAESVVVCERNVCFTRHFLF